MPPPPREGRDEVREETLAVDSAVNVSLCEQLLQNLKRAISRGVYQPGERLPGVHALAAQAGVSTKVSRQALARLAKIGWCESRRGTRSVVADRGKDRRGRVLFFNAETGFGFHSSRLVGALRARLLTADYCLTAISAYDLKKDGSSRLLSESLKEHWDLVIEMGMRPMARQAIESAGWPFVVLGDGGRSVPSDAANCVGRIDLLNGLAAPEFVRSCVAGRVQSVVQFLYDEGGFDVAKALTAEGIDCETVRLPRVRVPFGMCRDAYAALTDRLKAGRALPDVLLFTDDHLAQGGLLALMARGLRVPEDVRVVTHANHGQGPFWIKPLTRLEMDPVAQGRDIAEAVLAFLRTDNFPKDLCLGSVWRPGRTF